MAPTLFLHMLCFLPFRFYSVLVLFYSGNLIFSTRETNVERGKKEFFSFKIVWVGRCFGKCVS